MPLEGFDKRQLIALVSLHGLLASNALGTFLTAHADAKEQMNYIPGDAVSGLVGAAFMIAERFLESSPDA